MGKGAGQSLWRGKLICDGQLAFNSAKKYGCVHTQNGSKNEQIRPFELNV